MVCVRVRPLHPEIELGHEHIVTSTEKDLTVKSELHHDVKSQFDAVLQDVNQNAVFRTAVMPTLPHFLNGYNCTVFTYGQTGSGKTFTMFGPNINNKQREQQKPKIYHRNRFSSVTDSQSLQQ